MGGSSEPRVEDVLGLRAAPEPEPVPLPPPEGEDESSSAPTLEIVMPSWDEWNLTLRGVEVR